MIVSMVAVFMAGLAFLLAIVRPFLAGLFDRYETF